MKTFLSFLYFFGFNEGCLGTLRANKKQKLDYSQQESREIIKLVPSRFLYLVSELIKRPKGLLVFVPQHIQKINILEH